VCLSLQGAATGVTWNGGEAGGLAAVLFDDTTAAGSSNSINNVLIRPNTASDPSLVLVSLTGAGTRQLSGLYSLGSGYGVGSILQYGTAGRKSTATCRIWTFIRRMWARSRAFRSAPTRSSTPQALTSSTSKRRGPRR
jgi:hypothetical protein